MSNPRKRKALTLEERVEVVKRSRGGESARKIAEALGVGKTQIQSTIKESEEIMRRWESGENADAKMKARKCVYQELNEKMWEWFCDARGKNIAVSGKALQEKAIILSMELDFDKFDASNGWLEKWQKRYNVGCSVLSGEGAGVSEDVVKDWSKRLPDICKDYRKEDIFNADETGLFFKAVPTRSLVVKGETHSGVKQAKNRITALVAVSATGEKLKPLIIGKSAKPRCFHGVNLAHLGIHYYFNKKAWMTRDVFRDWAQKLNNKMRAQGRKILLFLDNCSAHPPMELSNVKLVLLPPNTTSRLQPCDAAIIQALKLNYRKQLLRHILCKMDMDPTATGPEMVGSVTLLDAILWWKAAYEQLRPETIVKCFDNCGFTGETTVTGMSADAQYLEAVEETQELDTTFQQLLPQNVSMEDFAACDNQIKTRHEEEAGTAPAAENDEGDDDGQDNGDCEEQPCISRQTAVTYAQELLKFSVTQGMPVHNLRNFVKDMEDFILKQKQSPKQTLISQHFMPKTQ